MIVITIAARSLFLRCPASNCLLHNAGELGFSMREGARTPNDVYPTVRAFVEAQRSRLSTPIPSDLYNECARELSLTTTSPTSTAHSAQPYASFAASSSSPSSPHGANNGAAAATVAQLPARVPPPMHHSNSLSSATPSSTPTHRPQLRTFPSEPLATSSPSTASSVASPVSGHASSPGVGTAGLRSTVYSARVLLDKARAFDLDNRPEDALQTLHRLLQILPGHGVESPVGEESGGPAASAVRLTELPSVVEHAGGRGGGGGDDDDLKMEAAVLRMRAFISKGLHNVTNSLGPACLLPRPTWLTLSTIRA